MNEKLPNEENQKQIENPGTTPEQSNEQNTLEVSEPSNVSNESNTSVQVVDTQPVNQNANKKNIKIIVALILLGVAAWGVFSMFPEMFMKEKDLFVMMEKKELGQMIDGAKQLVDYMTPELIDQLSKKPLAVREEYTLNINLSDKFQNDSARKFFEKINNSKLVFDGFFNTNDKKAKIDVTGNLGPVEVKGNAFQDNNQYGISIPGLSSKTLLVTSENMKSGIDMGNGYKLYHLFPNGNVIETFKLIGELMKRENTKEYLEIMSKYKDFLLQQIKESEVKIEKDVDVELPTGTVKAKKLILRLTDKRVNEISIALIEKLIKDDKTLELVIKNYKSFSQLVDRNSDEVSVDKIKDGLKEFVKSMKDAKFEKETVIFQMDMYLSGIFNDVVKQTIQDPRESDKLEIIKYTKDGKNYMNFNIIGQGEVRGTLAIENSKENGKDKNVIILKDSKKEYVEITLLQGGNRENRDVEFITKIKEPIDIPFLRSIPKFEFSIKSKINQNSSGYKGDGNIEIKIPDIFDAIIKCNVEGKFGETKPMPTYDSSNSIDYNSASYEEKERFFQEIQSNYLGAISKFQ